MHLNDNLLTKAWTALVNESEGRLKAEKLGDPSLGREPGRIGHYMSALRHAIGLCGLHNVRFKRTSVMVIGPLVRGPNRGPDTRKAELNARSAPASIGLC